MRSQSCDAQLVKAEAEYNLCQFEHALVTYYRGKPRAKKLDYVGLSSQWTLSLMSLKTDVGTDSCFHNNRYNKN